MSLEAKFLMLLPICHARHIPTAQWWLKLHNRWITCLQ